MEKIDRRQIQSQKKLHNAYLAMIKEKNHQFTIQELCDLADVTRPTFYRLFKDFQELRLDIHNTVLQELKNALTIVEPKPLNEASYKEMTTNLNLFFEHVLSNKMVYETFIIIDPDALFINQVKELIYVYVNEGFELSLAKDQIINVKESLIIAFLTGAHIESIIFWIKEQYETPLEEMVKYLIDLSINTVLK